MKKIVIYTRGHCPYCIKAKELLAKKELKYDEVCLDMNPAKLEEMKQLSGRHTVPQIFINGESIGGCDDLYELNRSGKLDFLLKK